MAEPFLRARYAENNVILSLCEQLKVDPAKEAAALFLTVDQGNGVVAAAMRTPPWNLLVTAIPNEVLPVLLEEVRAADPETPGVTGPRATADAFASAWCVGKGKCPRLVMAQGIYELTSLTPAKGVRGRLRAATAADQAIVDDWAVAFAVDAGLPVHERNNAVLRIRELLHLGTVFLWEDEGPVSMAAYVPVAPGACRVSFVYTPVRVRGRGYASACVGALSQARLDAGDQRCFLFTDIANPTSNAIYARLGYRLVAESAMWRFDGATDL